jgi:hypothetical protein
MGRGLATSLPRTTPPDKLIETEQRGLGLSPDEIRDKENKAIPLLIILKIEPDLQP